VTSLVVGFACGALINYYGMTALSNGPLSNLSWSVVGQRNVVIAILCAHLLVGSLLNVYAIRQALRRGVGLKTGAVLGFALSFPAYWLLVVWEFLQV
jgi:hypothetical protein